VLTGSARLAQEISERDAKLRQQEDVQRRTRELRQGIVQGQAELAAVQDRIAARQAELEQIAGREERLEADALAARVAMGAQRWADPAGGDSREQR